MIKRMTSITAFLSLLVLAMVGCSQDQSLPTSAIYTEGVDQPTDEAAALSKFFTGRDSVGVAMKFGVAGGDVAVTSDDRCGSDDMVVLSGSGNATHLGRVEGTFSHCMGDDFYSGEFELAGTDGAFITGVYPPAPPVVIDAVGKNVNGDAVETKAEINGGAVDAVQRDEVEGRGDLRVLVMPDEGFELTFDGWLLHHLAED